MLRSVDPNGDKLTAYLSAIILNNLESLESLETDIAIVAAIGISLVQLSL